jgi:DNA-binding MarR family transcriptional regulator
MMPQSLDRTIGWTSVKTSKKITRVVNTYLKPYNITTEQWSVLRTLHDLDDITQKELSDKSDKDQATLTKILDLLEARELIRRIPHHADRRSFLIRITDKGKQLVKQLIPFLEDLFAKIIQGIDVDSLAIYQEVLHAIETNIHALIDHRES